MCVGRKDEGLEKGTKCEVKDVEGPYETGVWEPQVRRGMGFTRRGRRKHRTGSESRVTFRVEQWMVSERTGGIDCIVGYREIYK